MRVNILNVLSDEGVRSAIFLFRKRLYSYQPKRFTLEIPEIPFFLGNL